MKKCDLLSIIFVFVALAGICLANDEAKKVKPEQSVVHILNSRQAPMWDAPWRFDNIRRGSGTGFIIEGNRIMTNAHVVGWSKELIVKRYQDPRSYHASVVYAGHDCDLAILTVKDESFFKGTTPLTFGDLPKVRTGVTTFGYPAGGRQISYTRGVVSRIEMQSYSHIRNRSFLVAQTDAAINPGNSGGPVIQDGKVVGVAFQGASRLENTGFFIPPPIINHFLDDIKDGTYHGFPTVALKIRSLENPAFRSYLKLEKPGVGALIDGFLPYSPLTKLIMEDDVLLSVQGYEVGSDGMILYEGNRIHVGFLFDSVQHGEKVKTKIWRKGAELDIDIPVDIYDADKRTGRQYGSLPRYYVHGGLVFVPLSLDYLAKVGSDLGRVSYPSLYYELFHHANEKPDKAREEPVVLARLLAHEINADFQIQSNALVDSINGVKINKLEDVKKAFDEGKETFHVIRFVEGKQIETLNREETKKFNELILRSYGVQKEARW